MAKVVVTDPKTGRKIVREEEPRLTPDDVARKSLEAERQRRKDAGESSMTKEEEREFLQDCVDSMDGSQRANFTRRVERGW